MYICIYIYDETLAHGSLGYMGLADLLWVGLSLGHGKEVVVSLGKSRISLGKQHVLIGNSI